MVFVFSFLPVIAMAQNSLNTNLLFHWEDTSLVGSAAFDNVYNEIWGIAKDGREYAVIGSTDGTHIFDVTNPEEASQVAYVAGAYQGAGVIHRDYHDYRGYLYIVCDEGPSTLQIVDVSALPDSVTLVYDSDELFTTSHNIFIDTTTAKMYSSNGAIYSLENPENPTFMYSTPDLASHDMYVQNDTAYINWGGGGLNVVDFNTMQEGTPNTHTMIGHLDAYPYQGYNHSGWLTEDGNYYVMADENHGHQMKMLDVSDLSNITVVSTFFSGEDSSECMPHNQIIHDQYVYTAYYHDGLRVHDISDPHNPELVAYYDTFEPDHYNSYMGAWGVYPFLPSGNILVSDMQTGLYVFEIDYPDVTVVEEQSSVYASVYPNPVREYLNVETLGSDLVCGSIYNMQGQKVISFAFEGKEQVDVSMLSDGFYILELDVREGVRRQKIVKQ